jgi:hypothetical protein
MDDCMQQHAKAFMGFACVLVICMITCSSMQKHAWSLHVAKIFWQLNTNLKIIGSHVFACTLSTGVRILGEAKIFGEVNMALSRGPFGRAAPGILKSASVILYGEKFIGGL